VVETLRVLFVEDSSADAERVILALQGTGRPVELERVQTAEAMRAALLGGRWDIVLSDGFMPGFSAAAALEVLKELRRDEPLIIVSATVGEEAAVDAMRAGARDYVSMDRLARLAPAVDREVREARERTARRHADEAAREADAELRRVAESEALLARLKAELEDRVAQRTSELTERLKEREVLLQEIHHRVKNNLQVVSSLISMQMRRLPDAAGRRALGECRNRVHAMALIHDKLYQAENHASVPFAEYAQRLAMDVLGASEASPARVTLELAFEDVPMTVDRAIPCGLILNELITNALKHAFPEGRRGTIGIAFERVEGSRLRLAVWDDGAGLPPGTDLRRSPSLGMHLVFMLAQQLDGAVEVGSEGGTRFELTFPATAA
jgi:two-component sensor histidine kinase